MNSICNVSSISNANSISNVNSICRIDLVSTTNGVDYEKESAGGGIPRL